jgi:1-phosphatidylinositol-4-phosphate 5-kinase
LPDKDRSEKRHFIFYQYEGGMRATGEHNEPADAIYYLGIIDILTPYTLYKRVEHLAKSFKYDGDTISAVDPVLYASRFLRFMSSSIRGGDMSIKDPALKPKVRRSPRSANLTDDFRQTD